jgi:formylglycine-generating enzyme required for sulfatase activity
MLAMFPALALSFLQPPARAADSEGDQVTKPYLNGTVRVSGAGGDGFGFIVGQDHGVLSIVTAKHVVTADNPSSDSLVRVYFHSNPSEPINVDISTVVTPKALDLALLQVNRPGGLDWQPQPACNQFQRNDKVWWVGRDKQWDVPLDNEAGLLKDSKPNADSDHIEFSALGVKHGVSGAPLIGSTGILGMVVVDNTNAAEALPVARIQPFVAQHGAWSLAGCGMAQATKSATPPPNAVELTTEVGRNKPDLAGVSGKPTSPMPETVVARPYSGLQADEGKTSSQLKSFRDNLKDGGLGPEMVVIPAGTFMMGSSDNKPGRGFDEGPRHAVTIQSFAMGRYEVTFDDYDRFTRATGRNLPADAGWGRGNRPVFYVSWDDAQAYANWLSAQTGHTYRLPTEAEWEYAARAGTTTAYWWGAQASHKQANYGKDESGGGLAQGRDQWVHTAPVGSFPPNDFGLYDTAGNVWEWVADCLHESYQHAPADGSAWMQEDGGDCDRRGVRGGSWLYGPRILRSAGRDGNWPDAAYVNQGFRLARVM